MSCDVEGFTAALADFGFRMRYEAEGVAFELVFGDFTYVWGMATDDEIYWETDYGKTVFAIADPDPDDTWTPSDDPWESDIMAALPGVLLRHMGEALAGVLTNAIIKGYADCLKYEAPDSLEFMRTKLRELADDGVHVALNRYRDDLLCEYTFKWEVTIGDCELHAEPLGFGTVIMWDNGYADYYSEYSVPGWCDELVKQVAY